MKLPQLLLKSKTNHLVQLQKKPRHLPHVPKVAKKTENQAVSVTGLEIEMVTEKTEARAANEITTERGAEAASAAVKKSRFLNEDEVGLEKENEIVMTDHRKIGHVDDLAHPFASEDGKTGVPERRIVLSLTKTNCQAKPL